MEQVYLNYEQGLAKYYSGEYDKAIALFNRQVEKSPDFPELFLYRGHSKFLLNDLPGACQDWKKALNLGNAGADKFIRKYCR
jgi:tetratricopeptide (TPR) repeat protein